MEYIKKEFGSYNLHLIKTDKFKTITVKVLFHTPMKKEMITSRVLLSDILLQSCRKFRSKRKMTIEAEELYACDITINNQRLGNYLLTSFNLQVLNDKYTENNNMASAIDFLSEIIFNPDCEENQFKEEKLGIAKYNCEVTINSIKEDASNYSLMRAAEVYDDSSPVSYRMIGYLDDLEMIDCASLFQEYQSMVNDDLVDIFVVGDFNDSEVLEIIKEKFKFRKIKKNKGDYYLKSRRTHKKEFIETESIENTQSKLAMFCPLEKMSPDEISYALILFNIILGGGTDSKLFKEVREKNSLCYTIHSFVSKFDNLLLITAGIDKENFVKTKDLIKEQLQAIRKGKFTDKDIEVAKEFYKTSLEEVTETEGRVMSEYISEVLFDIEPVDVRLQKIEKVNKKDIIKVSKKVDIDTIFLLEGVKNAED